MLQTLTSWLAELSPTSRIFTIIGLALAAHFVARLARSLGERLLDPEDVRDAYVRRYPRLATVITILVSTFTFVVYFGAIGLLFQEMGISLKTYVASATVIGLAVGFGLQGLVQDVVTGMTLIFSDTLNVGEMVDLSGQTGRVDRIGLRFTTLKNLIDQQVHVPNRNINMIGRYRNGYVRAYVDVMVTEKVGSERLAEVMKPLASGMHAEYPAIVLTEPEIMGMQTAGAWNYLRIKFRIWPGQGALIETGFRDRSLASLRPLDPDYAAWMISVTYRAE